MDWRILVGIGVGILAVWGTLLALLWAFRPRDARLGEVVRVIPDVIRLVRQLLRDPTTSPGARLALIGLFAYLLNPIDLIPEFIPVLGSLDDVVVAVLVLRYVRRKVGEDELRSRWPGSPEGFALLGRLIGSESGAGSRRRCRR
jgi:uncharacterized membrane protein YkvA (DUF1232 family)